MRTCSLGAQPGTREQLVSPASHDPALFCRGTQSCSDRGAVRRKSSHGLPGSLNSFQPSMNLTYRAACFLSSTHFRALSCWQGEAVSLGRACSGRHLCVCLPHLSQPPRFPCRFSTGEGAPAGQAGTELDQRNPRAFGPDHTANMGKMHLQPLKKLW